MLPGFVDRLNKELENLQRSPASTLMHISTPPMKDAAWVGGKVISSLSTFVAMSTSKYDYDEIGPSIIHFKHFT